MELYTLSSKLLPRDSVGEFTSAIWTERYSSAGDVQLVVQAIPSQIEKLAKGTLLGLRGTKEIMMLDTQTVQDGLLTVTGFSISKFLNERQALFQNPEYDGSDATVRLASEFTSDTLDAGEFISTVVDMLVIHPTAYVSHWAPINIDWGRDKMVNLHLGVVDRNGAPKRLSLPIGPLYDGIQQIAEEEGVGFKLYLDSASYTGGYVLRFATYRGKDRTSGQSGNLLIRLAPQLDSLSDVKEVNSISNYKNVFYVMYKNEVSTHYIPGLPIPTGFNRRVMLVEAPDIFLEPGNIPPFREQVARNTIANHIYVKAVDGQISEQIGYKFGVDYYLGDIIELEGYTGLISKARVTEYIRSEDQFGEKQYPTLDVLDPLFVGYMPDVEPDSNFDTGFDDDPDYDFDPDPDDEDDPEIIPPSERDPRDPPEHNPDPVYDFPPEDEVDDEAGDRVGGDLTLDPDNEDVNNKGVGWYLHHGRIYLEGSVYYGVTGDPGGRITTVGGVPEEARPASNVEFTFYPDSDSDSIYGHFTTFDGLVTPDGTITVSPTPRTSESGFELYLLLGNVSWPVNPPVEGLGPDTAVKEALDQWLIQNPSFSNPPDFIPTATSQGATIGAHGIRAHLEGDATLVEPATGNVIQNLPEKYRPSRFADTIAVPSSGGRWWPGYASDKGALTLKKQLSKPLIRAATLDEWVHGEAWSPMALIEADLSFWEMPINIWLGGGVPESSIRLEGHWSPPESSLLHTEFGFFISFGKSALDESSTVWYKVAAEKMDEDHGNEWWMILTVYYNVIGWSGNQEIPLYMRIPMARLDQDGPYQGELPNGAYMVVEIEPIQADDILQISCNVRGTRYMFEYPQQLWDIGFQPIWPSQFNATMQWGAIYTLAETSSGQLAPVSNLTNIKGDYFVPNNSNFYPPTWLPRYGQVDVGDQVNLNGLGWRVSKP